MKENVSDKALRLYKEDGGVTISMTGAIPVSGYAISLRVFEQTIKTPLTKRDIQDYIFVNWDFLIKKGHYLGIWKDGDTVYLDVTEVTEDREFALQLGKLNRQKAIYNLDKKEVILC